MSKIPECHDCGPYLCVCPGTVASPACGCACHDCCTRCDCDDEVEVVRDDCD